MNGSDELPLIRLFLPHCKRMSGRSSLPFKTKDAHRGGRGGYEPGDACERVVVVLVLETVSPSVFDLPFDRPPEHSSTRNCNRLLTIEDEDE